MLRYLLDEHIHHAHRAQLLSQDESIVVRKIGEPGAPTRGTLDPDLLIWCEDNAATAIPDEYRDRITYIPFW